VRLGSISDTDGKGVSRGRECQLRKRYGEARIEVDHLLLLKKNLRINSKFGHEAHYYATLHHVRVRFALVAFLPDLRARLLPRTAKN
jgi:hypothetical protein